MAETPEQDRRRWPRLKVQLDVRLAFTANETVFKCESADLSRGGIFVYTSEVRRPGTVVRMDVTVGDRPMTMEGIVVRALKPRGGRRSGMGIKFTVIDPDDQRFVTELIDSSQPED